ncbi:hypothetical protein KJ996_03935, partial [Patescibacteria group bacterium]|nr:hypothetical protein [Patescibacteria group bacterium]
FPATRLFALRAVLLTVLMHRAHNAFFTTTTGPDMQPLFGRNFSALAHLQVLGAVLFSVRRLVASFDPAGFIFCGTNGRCGEETRNARRPTIEIFLSCAK